MLLARTRPLAARLPASYSALLCHPCSRSRASHVGSVIPWRHFSVAASASAIPHTPQSSALLAESSSGSSFSSSSSSAPRQSFFFPVIILAVGSATFTLGLMLAPHVNDAYTKATQLSSLRSAADALAAIQSTEFPTPPLPSNAPTWLRALVADAEFSYKDVAAVFPTNGHLLYDGLTSDSQIRSFYHFVQRAPSPSSTDFAPLVSVVFHVGDRVCGHRGIVHGGLTAAFIDQVSGEACFTAYGPGAFTANLNVNYTQPVLADSWLKVTAKAVRKEGRKIWVQVNVTDGEEGGVEYANGSALFVRPKWVQENNKEWLIDANAVKGAKEKQLQHQRAG